MPYSEIDICNIALSEFGADAIRSFGEDNKRARMCKNFYDVTRDYLYAVFDWPFARKFKNLNELDLSAEDVPDGEHGFALPSDCLVARDVHPPGSSTAWRISGTILYTPLSAVGLYYTRTETNSAIFSLAFINALASALAVRLCLPISQDKAAAKVLYAQFKQELRDCQEADANIGNDYRMFDEDPDNDSFVTGETLGSRRLVPDVDWAE